MKITFPNYVAKTSVLVAISQILLLSALWVGLVFNQAVADDIGGWPAPDAIQLHSDLDPQPAVELQVALQNKLASLGLGQAVARGQLAVTLVDISNPAQPRLAQANGHQMLYAASLPKIAILLAAHQKAADTGQPLSAYHRQRLGQMIRKSSNAAATEMLNWAGRGYLLDVLQSPRYGFYDQQAGGGLWVGKPYGRAPAYQRDPLHKLSHGATTFQTARFLYLLERGELVSVADSAQMKAAMSAPAIKHKFVGGLATHRPQALLYRKSGTWRSWHADAAIVEDGQRKYIAVALANNRAGEQWLRKLIVGLDELVKSNDVAAAGVDTRG